MVRVAGVSGRHSLVANQRPTVVQARQDDQRVLHVLSEIHEPVLRPHGANDCSSAPSSVRPSASSPVELIDRHQGRAPSGGYEPVERADDLSARNAARADGMRARLLGIDCQPLDQRVPDVLMGEILAVGQDEGKRYVHGDPIPRPAAEMHLQVSADDLQVGEFERPRHEDIDLRSLQPNRSTPRPWRTVRNWVPSLSTSRCSASP